MPTYLETIAAQSRQLADTLVPEHLAAVVPSCPGWSLADLAAHLGWVQRWARLAALTGQQPEPDEIDPAPDADALAEWIVAGADALVETLAAVPADAPTWHPFPVPLIAGVWPRRQAHEVTIHRWDAQSAIGVPSPLDPGAATDFVAEYFEVVVPRVVARDGRTPPAGDLRIALTDTAVTLHVHVDGSMVTVLDEAPPIATARVGLLSGTAEDVLLALWRRAPLALPGPDTDGLTTDWLAFGGN
jgi:uncharacterized protein (TIGR03083 family)